MINNHFFIGQRVEAEVSPEMKWLYRKHRSWNVLQHVGLDAAKYLNDYEAIGLMIFYS